MLKVGYAQEVMTPPTGIDLAGYFNVRLNEGMYDDLFVKVIAIEIDGKRTGLVTLELCSIVKPLFEAIKAKVDAEFGHSHPHRSPLQKSGKAG